MARPRRRGRGFPAAFLGLLAGTIVLLHPSLSPAAPPGTLMQNIASTSFGPGVPPSTLPSNQTIVTVDNAVAVAISPPGSAVVYPGTSVAYRHTVTNQGNVPDVMDIQATTRYGLLTGRYAWRTWLKRGVIGGYTPPLVGPTRPTLASGLKAAGYRTGFYGKWHLGLGWTRANGSVPTFKDAVRLFRGSWQDADPSTGLNVDFAKPVEGGPTALGFDEAFFTAACSTIDGPFTFIENNRVTAIPDRQVSEFYDLSKGEEGSPRRGWIAPGFKLEEVDLPTATTNGYTSCTRR